MATRKTGQFADKRSRHAATTQVWRAADESAARAVSGGAACYDRRRSLPRLIGWVPEISGAENEASDRAIQARLTRALRAERQRGRAGHWAYDLNRHLALLQALEGEAQRRRSAVGQT